MNRLRWQLKTWLSVLGREGSLGLALLVASLVVYLITLNPIQSQLTNLQQDIDVLSTPEHTHAKPGPATTAEQLEAYYQFFPPQSSAPDWLDKIYKAARKQRLELIEGKYRAKPQRAGSLIRYEITLPVTGDYRQIQNFLAAVLTEVPVAALDGVTFERSKIGDAAVVAKIKLTLYLGQPT